MHLVNRISFLLLKCAFVSQITLFADVYSYCNAVMYYTTGFGAVSIFILDCWNMINFIVDDDIVGSSVVVAL